MASAHYVIRGGQRGWERLQVLARVMQPVTCALLEQVGIETAAHCLDIGCGGGHVACELARRVGPRGQAVGVDIDETKLSLARREAARLGLLRDCRYSLCDCRPAAHRAGVGLSRRQKYAFVIQADDEISGFR